MNLAREINEKLDEILRHKLEIKAVELDYQDPDFVLEDAKTGEKVTKEMVFSRAGEIYEGIISDLNKLTNDGKNAKDLFTNQYYINDTSQDKLIADEIRANKLAIEEAKQLNANN